MSNYNPNTTNLSIKLHFGSVETIKKQHGYTYEWRFLGDDGKLLYQSNVNYGNPIPAIRDALLVVIGLPNLLSLKEMEKIRDQLP